MNDDKANIASELSETLDVFVGKCRALIGEDDAIVGIRRGGLALAWHLNEALGRPGQVGELDVNFYRDDFGRRLPRSDVSPSANLPPLDGARIVLVDDVLWTGRTIRAALNELFDFGRPAHIALAVLFDRGGRELPIEAAVVGRTIQLPEREQIKLHIDQGQLGCRITAFSEPPAGKGGSGQ